MSSKVLAGKYEGKSIVVINDKVLITIGFKSIEISKENVVKYEVITEEHRKSASSGVARGLVGGALIGPVGALAGGLSAKNNSKYQIAIEFNDGMRSLIELDNKAYKIFLKQMFESGYSSNECEIINSKSNKSNKNYLVKFIGGMFLIVIMLVLIQLLNRKEVFINSNNPKIQYNVLGEKQVNGLYGKCYRIGIEEPSDMNINNIAESLLNKYNFDDLEELKIYMYEKGKTIENMNEMFVGSKYELNITKEESGYSYYLWDVVNDLKIEDGLLDF